MPGDRLSQDERRAIGVGLADGLGYAEIARRLDRPTSTVSREVTRNGGPRGYRAEHAHHATAYRARRRTPLDRPTVPGEEPKVLEFIGRLTDTMVANGVPRMAARVLARLYTTDEPSLTAAQLVRQLQVSPASISKAIGYLEELEMVERGRAPQSRREHYIIADDVWMRAWITSARANASWAETAREGAALFDPGTPAGARLQQMARFFTQLSDDMSGGTSSAAADDIATILAALLHARRPLTAAELADALDWAPERVAEALGDAETYAPFTDPLALERPTPTAYAVTAAPGRLTPAQRSALLS
ncbi:MarR family transcriptional regulator [Kribbella sp. DT2]|uniref:GbsR/MarR family transcriptional regulator n=1 Tax=Kribbella sp. DT2 TaxID=3393427 RepID=UPI003CFA3A34